MKVLFFPKYTRSGGSSRLRTYQYLELYREAGIEFEVSPLFSDAYLQEVYKYKRHNKLKALKGIIKRFATVFKTRSFDLVIIEKELIPYFPPILEYFLKLSGVKYILDFDDAIWHNYDSDRRWLVRAVLGRKVKRIIKWATHVVVGNDYLKEYASESIDEKSITIIPTVVNINKYKTKTFFDSNEITIGWIGSPITFKYLPRLAEVFEALGEKYNLNLKLIGANRKVGLKNVNESLIIWDERTEAQEISEFDIGIMPLEDNIWERGKCGYKLIQYMACSLPVIGTPIGINNNIIVAGINGFKATTLEEWNETLSSLILDKEKRIKMGKEGRIMVEKDYSLFKAVKVWVDTIYKTG